MTTFRNSLEEKARRLADVSGREPWDNSVPSTLRRQIALTVEQINRERDIYKQQLRQLLRRECSVRTDIMQLKQQQSRYAPIHSPEKDRLKQRLSDIEKERRKLSQRLEEKTQSLEDRLLNLINKHEQLDM